MTYQSSHLVFDDFNFRQNIFFCVRQPLRTFFCMFKNVSVFPRVNVDARRMSDQRQSNARHK